MPVKLIYHVTTIESARNIYNFVKICCVENENSMPTMLINCRLRGCLSLDVNMKYSRIFNATKSRTRINL